MPVFFPYITVRKPQERYFAIDLVITLLIVSEISGRILLCVLANSFLHLHLNLRVVFWKEQGLRTHEPIDEVSWCDLDQRTYEKIGTDLIHPSYHHTCTQSAPNPLWMDANRSGRELRELDRSRRKPIRNLSISVRFPQILRLVSTVANCVLIARVNGRF